MGAVDIFLATASLALVSFVIYTTTLHPGGGWGADPDLINTRHYFADVGSEFDRPRVKAERTTNAYIFILLGIASFMIFIGGVMGGVFSPKKNYVNLRKESFNELLTNVNAKKDLGKFL